MDDIVYSDTLMVPDVRLPVSEYPNISGRNQRLAPGFQEIAKNTRGGIIKTDPTAGKALTKHKKRKKKEGREKIWIFEN